MRRTRRSQRLDDLLVTACAGDDHLRRQARICYSRDSLRLAGALGTIWIVDLLQASGLVGSRHEAKRLIQQGGVKVNEERIDSQGLDVPFDPPVLVHVGKRSVVMVV